ncbi:hypothetical protein L207DRAFT_458702 [Hyaloscypha variabilis F]|uniref:Uncharacterized protein n=1 Tax=Hyaloscypha variabilis (strain UAMH 11265 / GT02V1 / F) TaxID=1149755 RepID=A0A2J6RNY1_HYAVF|nr:hypothetical protein L207DRAFT_458702 [Hyaloscypha variabilis F]
MAELVGVVASGISIGALAAQIAASISKLKSYWDEIQEAPDDIASLIEEISDLHMLLADIEDDQRRNPMFSLLLDGVASSRCLEHCKRAADRLSELVDEVATDIQSSSGVKRRWASAKVVLKKDSLEKYRSKLERTIRLMTLSHQCYTRALVQLQPDIIVSKLKQLSAPEPNTDSNLRDVDLISSEQLAVSSSTASLNRTRSMSNEITGSYAFWIPMLSIHYERASVYSTQSHTQNEEVDKRLKSLHKLRARMRGPISILNRFWEISGHNAENGWKISIRTYNIISFDSLTFKYTAEGNIEGLKDLFGKGEASPYDATPGGDTLLFTAVECGNAQLCRFLIEQGAEAEPGVGVLSPLTTAIIISGAWGYKNGEEILRLLLQHGSNSPTTSSMRYYRGNVEGFQLLTNHMDIEYQRLPIDERVNLAISLMENVPYTKPELVRVALGQWSLDTSVINVIDYRGKTLFHAVAFTIGRLTSLGFAWKRPGNERYILPEYEPKKYWLEYVQSWRLLLKEIITAGADLHIISQDGKSPLLSLLGGIFSNYCIYGSRLIPAILKMWLDDLRDSGVDILKYGMIERRLLERGVLNRTLRYEDCQLGYYHTRFVYPRHPSWRLINFTYGANPEDWFVWGSDIWDGIAGEFWTMVENTGRQMPGAWVENSEDEDSD